MKILAITLSMIVAVAFATPSFAGPGEASSKMNKAAVAIAGGLRG
jgi:hypothetical protein